MHDAIECSRDQVNYRDGQCWNIFNAYKLNDAINYKEEKRKGLLASFYFSNFVTTKFYLCVIYIRVYQKKNNYFISAFYLGDSDFEYTSRSQMENPS